MQATKVYLDATVTLTPEDSKSDIVFEFEIDMPCETVYIDAAYFPKYFYDPAAAEALIEQSVRQYGLDPATDLFGDAPDSVFPLANLIALSLDSGGCYRGAAHRHANAQHIVLSEGEATGGFSPGRPPQGRWRITIHPYCVLTARCDYHITVTGVRGQAAAGGVGNDF